MASRLSARRRLFGDVETGDVQLELKSAMKDEVRRFKARYTVLPPSPPHSDDEEKFNYGDPAVIALRNSFSPIHRNGDTENPEKSELLEEDQESVHISQRTEVDEGEKERVARESRPARSLPAVSIPDYFRATKKAPKRKPQLEEEKPTEDKKLKSD